jgi:hypothetical protein
MLAPMVALVIGAAGAVGAYAALDDTDVGVQPARVIVTEAPAPPSEGVAAKDEAATAAAVAGSIPSSSSFGKDEAKIAAAVGNANRAADRAPTPQGIPSPAATAAAERARELQEQAIRTDPLGQKSLQRP